MAGKDTQIGEGGGSFPATSWGFIAGIQDSSTQVKQNALESLCRRYWKPVYHYVRRAWSKSSEDAKDLTQAFFLNLLEGDSLKRYTPGRGGFRPYLKVLLRGFSADQHQAMKALKRGGGRKRLAIDDEDAPLKEILADPRAEDPERAFDMAWKKTVLERAVERTREWLTSVGRAHQFRAFEEYEFGEGPEEVTYGGVAKKLGISESDVRNHLFAVRERIRLEIRGELTQTVSDMGELDSEWSALFGS